MAKVTIVSSTTVKAPTTEEPINTKLNLSLSELKLLLVGPIQKGVLLPNPNSKPDQLISNLKSSLSKTLQLFHPLSGRLNIRRHKGDDSVSYYIDCNNDGVLFVHAVAKSVAIGDILQPIYIPPIVQEFFTLSELKNCDGVSNPLVGIRITELSDGIFIGCTMYHSVADGSTFWSFINAWSEIWRGLDQISKPPVFDNWLRSFPVRLPVSILEVSDEFATPPLEERVFRFSKENIRRLKEKANAEVKDLNCSVTISSLQSVLAHLWRGVIRNRDIDPENDTKLDIQIGYRKRLKPEIPEEYFGCAIQSAPVELKVRQVKENGLGFVALQLNKTVSINTAEKVKNDIELWMKDPKLATMSGMTRDALVVSSSP